MRGGMCPDRAPHIPPAARARSDYDDPVPTSPPPARDAITPWVVLGAVWVTLAISSGLYFSFPVFFVALLEEFGWSRGATSLAFSISSIVQGLLSPGVGILVDRFGPRRLRGEPQLVGEEAGSLLGGSPTARGA